MMICKPKPLDACGFAAHGGGMQIRVPTARDVEAAARRAKTTVAAACREAGIDPSTFHRWRAAGSGISIEKVRALVGVIQGRRDRK